MIFVYPKGRMGNQMFQIAATYALSLDNNVDYLCGRHISGITPSSLEVEKHRATIFRNVMYGRLDNNCSVVHDDSQSFIFEPIKYTPNMCLGGYYQSEKYFSHRSKEIKDLFSPSKPIRNIMQKKFSNLLNDSNTCSVHVRRGDYLKYKDYHYNLTNRYYHSCFTKMTPDTHFVFFSDDITWCRNEFKDLNASFINTGFDVLDLHLMSCMKNNIIANSSFSWWAAWLNKNNDKKVLAPSVWFGEKNLHLSDKDLIPSDWSRNEV